MIWHDRVITDALEDNSCVGNKTDAVLDAADTITIPNGVSGLAGSNGGAGINNGGICTCQPAAATAAVATPEMLPPPSTAAATTRSDHI